MRMLGMPMRVRASFESNEGPRFFHCALARNGVRVRVEGVIGGAFT